MPGIHTCVTHNLAVRNNCTLQVLRVKDRWLNILTAAQVGSELESSARYSVIQEFIEIL